MRGTEEEDSRTEGLDCETCEGPMVFKEIKTGTIWSFDYVLPLHLLCDLHVRGKIDSQLQFITSYLQFHIARSKRPIRCHDLETNENIPSANE